MTKVGGGGKDAPAASTADLTERLERATMYEPVRADRNALYRDALNALQALEDEVNLDPDARLGVYKASRDQALRERDECRAQYRTAWTDLERERDEWKARAEQMKDYADSADRDQVRTVRERDEAREQARVANSDSWGRYRDAINEAEKLREALREAESEIHLYLNTFDVEGAANRLAQARDGIRAALSSSTGSDDG